LPVVPPVALASGPLPAGIRRGGRVRRCADDRVTTTFGIGYFGDPDLPIEDRIVSAQAGILTTSLCTLVLAALFAERRHQEAALREGATRLERPLRPEQ